MTKMTKAMKTAATTGYGASDPPSPLLLFGENGFCHEKARSWAMVVRGYILRELLGAFYRLRARTSTTTPAITVRNQG